MRSENEEKVNFRVHCIQVLRDRLPLITLHTNWLVWFSSDNCASFFLPKIDNRNICVDVYLVVNIFYLRMDIFMDKYSLSLSLKLIILLISNKLKLFCQLSLISHINVKNLGPNLTPENPTGTVLAIMLSSLNKI